MGAGILGSSASTTSKQSTRTTNQNVQNSAGSSTLSIDAGKGSTIYNTDGGAIARMADISQAAINLGAGALESGNSVAIAGLDYAKAAYQSSLDLVGDTLGKALAQSSQVAKSSTTTDSERMQQVALWVVGAFVAAWVIPKLPKLRGI